MVQASDPESPKPSLETLKVGTLYCTAEMLERTPQHRRRHGHHLRLHAPHRGEDVAVQRVGVCKQGIRLHHQRAVLHEHSSLESQGLWGFNGARRHCARLHWYTSMLQGARQPSGGRASYRKAHADVRNFSVPLYFYKVVLHVAHDFPGLHGHTISSEKKT